MTTTNVPADTDLAELRRIADAGAAAAEALSAAEHARQAANTEALAAAQESWDVETATRGPELDAQLTEQQRVAHEAMQTAVDAADLDGAFSAWRTGESARRAQLAWRDLWRGAHSRCGIGAAPPPASFRPFEATETAGFLVALTAGTDASANAAADRAIVGLFTERPTAVAADLLPGPEATLQHREGCAGPSRTEVVHPSAGRYSSGSVVRCMGCGASHTLLKPPPEPEDALAAAPGPALMRRPEPAEDYAHARDGWLTG